MKKATLEGLVRAALALSAKKPLPQIDVNASLAKLGGGDPAALDLTLRLYRAFSGKNNQMSFAQFCEHVTITPRSSLTTIATRLAPLMVSVHGDDPTEVKAAETDDAVRTVLAERTEDFSVFEIEPHQLLGEDLDLGPAEIAEIKIDLYKALGVAEEFPDYSSALESVDENSSVEQLMASLPGNDPTPIK